MTVRSGRTRRDRSFIVPVVATFFLVLAACGSNSTTTEDVAPRVPPIQHRTLDVDGIERTYRLYTPSTLDRARPAPLVLVLGGVGNTAESMVGATEFDRMAQVGDFVVAYPEGINATWNAGYCCLLGAPSGPDDVSFLSRVIDDVGANQDVDQGRVFVAGVSAGAMMAYRMGCERAERIAGVGSVAGAMILEDCQPSRPVAVIEIHGTTDPLVPYEGGDTAGGATQDSPPTMAVAERWAELNGCATPGSAETGGSVTTLNWSGCASGSSVSLVSIEGGGHTWFAPGLGPANGAVDATSAIWDFFSGLPPRG